MWDALISCGPSQLRLGRTFVRETRTRNGTETGVLIGDNCVDYVPSLSDSEYSGSWSSRNTWSTTRNDWNAREDRGTRNAEGSRGTHDTRSARRTQEYPD